MDSCYSVTRTSLFELLKKAFESGCYGYLDLRDSNCETLLDEFLEENNKPQKSFSIEDNVRQQALWPQTTVAVTASEGSWVGYAGGYTVVTDIGNQEAVSDGVMGESGGPVGPVGEVGESGLPGDPGVPGVMPDQNPMSSQGNGSEAI